MTPLSWLYMGLVWMGIIGLNTFCFYRIFSKKNDAAEKDNSKEEPPPLIH